MRIQKLLNLPTISLLAFVVGFLVGLLVMNLLCMRALNRAIWRLESADLNMALRMENHLKNENISGAIGLAQMNVDAGIEFLSAAKEEGHLDESGNRALTAALEYRQRWPRLPPADPSLTNEPIRLP